MDSQGEAVSHICCETHSPHIGGIAINSISGLLLGSDSPFRNITGFVLSVCRRDHAVLVTAEDVTAWHSESKKNVQVCGRVQ